MLVSIVIRTLNEEKYLEELLSSLENQEKEDFNIETVIIDSGSTDRTLDIAKNFNCRVTHISKNEFTFGKSLNMGSEFANGGILVYISGHCIPTDRYWLKNLIKPLLERLSDYTYGGQIGRDTTKFSESRIFEQYFPKKSKIPQNDFFCNNANSALNRDVWSLYKFNEEITGLEDMDLAKRIFLDNRKISYVSEASVYHIHDESWSQTRRRYERESIALQKIMPEINVSFFDMIRYISLSIINDCIAAKNESLLLKELFGIIRFRAAQYSGIYRGNHEQREISKRRKENYFYPSNSGGEE